MTGRPIIALCGLPLLLALAGGAVADGLPGVPKDYPSHSQVRGCNLDDVRRKLQDYNHCRLDIATVVRHLAEEQPMGAEAQKELLGFAANLEEMRARLPEPDPDSNAFREFDFRLGLTFAAMVLFLNTKDERLTARFVHDREDPNSELGRYLTRLDLSRRQYLDGLQAAARAGDCRR
jgi:hypothetical protein